MNCVLLQYLLAPITTATSNQECCGKGGHKGLYLRGGLQAAAREAGHRGHPQPEHWEVAAADGAHQGDDRRAACVQGHGGPEEGVVGAH